MNNAVVKESMDINLKKTYKGLVNLRCVSQHGGEIRLSNVFENRRLVALTGYDTREEDTDGLQTFSHWKRSMPRTFPLK